jgi:hypothetical protein
MHTQNVDHLPHGNKERDFECLIYGNDNVGQHLPGHDVLPYRTSARLDIENIPFV